jgi:LAO/AO transport system kinase
VMDLAETVIVVLVPESGDSVQVMKAGLNEIADLFVVNKADRPGAEKLRQDIEVTLGIRRGNAYRHVPAHHGSRDGTHTREDQAPNRWDHPVLLTIASKGEGIDPLIEALERHQHWLIASGELEQRRRQRLLERTREVVDRAARRWLWRETQAERMVRDRLDDVAHGRLSPYDLAAEILDGLRQGERV